MTHLADSRAEDGVGFLPLQDHGFSRRGGSLENRACIMAVRVAGRRVEAGDLGHWEIEEGSVGDVIGWSIWGGSRKIPAWRQAWPSKVTQAAGASDPGDDESDDGQTELEDPGDRVKPPDDGPEGEISPGTRPPFGGRGAAAAVDRYRTASSTPGSAGGSEPRRALGGPTFEAPPPDRPTSDKPNGGGFDMLPCPPQSPTFEAPRQGMRPIRDGSFRQDKRFSERTPFLPNGWNDFPGGTVTLIAPGTEETSQQDVALHCDPRLVAPNSAGSPTHGTWVCDLAEGGVFDASRKARLQTAFRVVRVPLGELGYKNNKQSVVALNIGSTGLGEAVGGLVVDYCKSTGTRIASLSVRHNGPLDVGGGVADKHNFASDAETNPIAACHLNGRVGWREHKVDGPLDFEPGGWPKPSEYPYPSQVHLRFDPEMPYKWPRDDESRSDLGKWRWFTTVPIAGTDDDDDDDGGGPTTPGGEPTGPTTGGPPPQGPTTPGSGPTGPTTGDDENDDDGDPRFSITIPESGHGTRRRHTYQTHREIALPAIVGRPQAIRAGVPDLRYAKRPTRKQLEQLRDRGPVSARIEAYGAQDGGGGEWDYAQDPRLSRAKGGTVAGGFAVLPPELDMADQLAAFAPAGVSPSQTYFVAAPGVRFGVGSPRVSDGGLASGFSWESEASTGDLVFYAHDGDGVATEALRIDASTYAVTAAGGLQADTIATTQSETFSPSNDSTVRSIDPTSTSLEEVANFAVTLVRDLAAGKVPSV